MAHINIYTVYIYIYINIMYLMLEVVMVWATSG